MKFRFLGNTDCPDWLLTEINTLSKLPALRMKLLAECVINFLVKYLSHNNQTGLKYWEYIYEQRKKEIGPDDLKRVFAALEFILSSAIRNEVTESILYSELLQIGLPQAHCSYLSSCYEKRKDNLHCAMTAQSLRLSELKSVNVVSNDKNSPVATIALKMKTLNTDEETATINIVKDDIPILLGELKKALSIMESLEE